MKLTKVRIKNFKCIHDSTEFDIDDLTCLVGKNESGKTAILQALRIFNPFETDLPGFDRQNDYPVENENKNENDLVEVTFSLEPKDIDEIHNFITCKCVSTDEPTITLSRDYRNNLRVVKYGFDVDVDAIINHISADAGIKPNPSMTDPTKRAKDLLDQLALSEDAPHHRILEAVADSTPRDLIYHLTLYPRIPKFIYFDEYPQMNSVVNITELINSIADENTRPSDQPILDILSSAGVNYSQIIKPSTANAQGIEIRKATSVIDKDLNEIFKSWSQHDIYRMESQILPENGDPFLRIYITDRRKEEGFLTRKPFETESDGFKWFFSFLMMHKHFDVDNNDVVLLLDEPGLSLHAKAQKDLLRFFEAELTSRHQVIYTTHSPFMIDSNHPDRVRLVENQSLKEDSNQKKYRDLGTKVSSNPFTVSKGSLLPLQAALGYDISQNMLIGKNNLIVEGVSDQVYVTTISRYLEKQGMVGLDPAWTIVPAGGIDKVPSLTRLLGANTDLDLAVLVDARKNGMQKIKNLYEDGIIDKNRVMTYADFIPSKNEADVEDMFTPDFYLDLINRVYSRSIKIGDLTNKHPRIIYRLEEYFKVHPLPNGKSHPETGKFSHFEPAIYFSHNITNILPKQVNTHFQDLFSKLNDLLVSDKHKQPVKSDDTQQLMKKFWTGLRDYMNNNNSSFEGPTPVPRSYLQLGIGSGNFLILITLTSSRKEIGIWLRMKGNDAKAHFHLLKEQQEEIHNEFGETLEWHELPDNQRSRICLSKGDMDLLDENSWPQQYEWLTTKLERFNQVFRPRIQALNAADWIPEEDDEPPMVRGKIADVIFTGQSGREYKFEVYPRETTFKDVGGVYGFSKRDSQGNHTLLYIGQTQSFKERRLAHHEKWECADPLGGNVICTHRESRETQREAIERDLIIKHTPPCNRQRSDI